MFTQPLMYKTIKNTKPVLDKYADKLIAEKVVTPEEVKVSFWSVLHCVLILYYIFLLTQKSAMQ